MKLDLFNQFKSRNSFKSSKLIFKFLQVIAVFLYMVLLLWSVILRPVVDVDERWVPRSFFSSARETTCFIHMHQAPTALLEAIFFTTIAMFGYFRGVGSMLNVDRNVYGRTLAQFEQAMMGVRQKFYWICLMPWLITFSQNWLQNLGELLVMFDARTMEAHNIYSTLLCLLAFVLVQAALASEIGCMALHGWCAMKNINDANIEWEQRKQDFAGDILGTVFGCAGID